MGDLPPIVLEDDLARNAPVAVAPAFPAQWVLAKLRLGRRQQQLAVRLALGLQSGQVVQTVVVVGKRQLVVQIGAVPDDDHVTNRPATPLQELS